MKSSKVLWALAFVLTLASAVWQRLSGPTHPARGRVSLDGTEVELRLLRSHGGAGDQPVRVVTADAAVTGEVAWRRFPTSEPWKALQMERRGDSLEAALPHQPPAAKLEYQVRLRRGGAEAVFPPRPAVTRFKGDVAAWLLVPHIAAMFAGMLTSTRAGLGVLVRERVGPLVGWTVAMLVVGGFILGPMIQKAAFGDWWTGVPFGYDLTDNKTLVAGLAWGWAAFLSARGKGSRAAVLVASILTLVVFAVPHSVWGSELQWQELGAFPPRGGLE
jgi:hypothetical protein